MTVTAQALQKIWRGEERMTDEMGLQTFPKTDTYDADVTFCGKQQPVKFDRLWLKNGCVRQWWW